MKCSTDQCPGELFFTESIKKEKGQRYKVLNYFCPTCGFVRMFDIQLTKKQFKKEEAKETVIMRT